MANEVRAADEKPGNQKEVWHPERLCEGDGGVQPPCLLERQSDTKRRVHGHDENDAEALA